MTNSTIRAQDLTVRRGGKDVLRGLDLEVSGGVITALLGPSGCGKTTLMRTVVGLQAISGGSMSVIGQPAGQPHCAGASVMRRRAARSTPT